jgi:hypothetical protein
MELITRCDGGERSEARFTRFVNEDLIFDELDFYL